MNRKIVTSVAVMAVLSLVACDEAAREAHKTRYQQTNDVQASEGLVFSSKGKAMTPIGAFPVRVKLAQSGPYQTSTIPAVCTLESVAFTAKVRMGSQIKLPSYGRKTPPMKVSCDLEGKVASAEVTAVNLTQIAYQAEAAGHVMFGFGLLGAAITAGQASERDKSKDIYGYPSQIEVKKQ